MFIKSLAILSSSLLVQAAPPSVGGFKLTWSDDFIGSANGLPSTNNWIVNSGTSYAGGPPNWGTGEIQTYMSRPQNVKLTGNGTLQITPLRDDSGGWTSARIETQRDDFQAAEGGLMRIAARLSLPDVHGEEAIGYWPAFWTLGDNYRGDFQNWPAVGEFDIMENVNGLDRSWGVLHCGVNPGGPCNETDGIAGNMQCPGSPCQGNFHEYAIVVDRSSSPEKITWSVDGQDFHVVTEEDIPDVWSQTVHHGHFVLLNVAMGGAFPNKNLGMATPVESTRPGVPLYVDWIAVYNSE